MKKNIIIIFTVLLLAVSLLNAQAVNGGVSDFIKYLEDNKDSLQYEKYTQTQKGDKNLVMVYCSLAVQKKLLDAFSQFAILEFRFEMAGENRVVTTTVFQGEAITSSKGHKFSLHNKMKVGVAGIYYYAMSKNIDAFYHRLLGASVDIAWRFAPKTDFWLSAAYVGRSAKTDYIEETFKLTLFPFSGAIRYFIMEKSKWDLYLGAGANFFLIRETNPVKDIKTTAVGITVLGGSYFKLSPNLSAQALLKFNIISKDVYPDLEFDNKLDLAGLELRLGVTYNF